MTVSYAGREASAWPPPHPESLLEDGREYESGAQVLETLVTSAGAFSEGQALTMLVVCPVYGLDVASLYLGGGVSLFDANSSSIEEKSLQLCLWRLTESDSCGLGLSLVFFDL